jgi:hypothetical protein
MAGMAGFTAWSSRAQYQSRKKGGKSRSSRSYFTAVTSPLLWPEDFSFDFFAFFSEALLYFLIKQFHHRSSKENEPFFLPRGEMKKVVAPIT